MPPPPFPEKLIGLNPLPPRPSPITVSPSPLPSPPTPPQPSPVPSIFPLPPPTKPSKNFAPRPILKKRLGKFPSPPPLRSIKVAPTASFKVSPPLKLDQNGKPIFKPSEICRIAIYRLPPRSTSQTIDTLLSSSRISITDVRVVPRRQEQSIVYCTVSSKKEMQRLIEWGDSQGFTVERAPPFDPNFSEYYHVLVRGLSSSSSSSSSSGESKKKGLGKMSLEDF